jgi:hypothetical protein
MTPNPPSPFQPTGRPRILLQSLSEKSPVLGELYDCAIRAFQEHGNPGRLFLAAHSIREMTKDLPKVLDVPMLTGYGRMRDKLDALERSWNHAPASDCHRGGAWSSEIDTRLRPVASINQRARRVCLCWAESCTVTVCNSSLLLISTPVTVPSIVCTRSLDCAPARRDSNVKRFIRKESNGGTVGASSTI